MGRSCARLRGTCASAARGGRCRQAGRPGAPCTVGFANGWSWGCLTACWRMSPGDAGAGGGAGPSRARASSTRKPSSAFRCAVPGGTTPPRRCSGASAWPWLMPMAPAVAVVPASVQDRDTLEALDPGKAAWPSLREAILDGAFTAARCQEWSNRHGMRHHVVERDPAQTGFVVLAGRWVVERSFGWLVHWGGLLRDRAGRLDVSAARLAFAASLSGVEALLNPMPVQDAAR